MMQRWFSVQGIKAREILHANMEKIIEEKMERQQVEEEHLDAFDYMLSSSKEQEYQLSIQELKVPTKKTTIKCCYLLFHGDFKLTPPSFLQETAVELIFAAHSTTASASTSLVLQLLHHPAVVERARVELEAEGLGYESHSRHSPSSVTSEKEEDNSETSCLLNERHQNQQDDAFPRSQSHVPYLSLDKLSQLRYVDCVVKEVLRFLPPVSGGYRTALQTFELDVSSSLWETNE